MRITYQAVTKQAIYCLDPNADGNHDILPVWGQGTVVCYPLIRSGGIMTKLWTYGDRTAVSADVVKQPIDNVG